MTDQSPEAPEPITYGPTRAMLAIYDTNPPGVIFLDTNGNTVSTVGQDTDMVQVIRDALVAALPPIPQPEDPKAPEDEKPERPKPERPKPGKGGKGKGKNRRPQPEASDIDDTELAGLSDVVTVNAAVNIHEGDFRDWYSQTKGGDTPDPALHPQLVAEFLGRDQ